jgi:RHS repeat-associated protein
MRRFGNPDSSQSLAPALHVSLTIYQLLSAAQGGTTTESYSYDPVGNRLSSLGVASYTVNSSNELTADSNASFSYDNNGNTTSKTDSTGTTNYSWDFENRLSSVTLPNSGGTVSFKYDPFGRRIEKISPNATSIFAYDGDDLVETVNSSGSTVARYTQGPNIDEPLAMERGTTTDYYEADGLGSITSLTGSTGSIGQSYTYDSFGNTTNSSGSLTNFFRYTARDFDTETNLYYYRARYYDPTLGRFMSDDPVELAGGDVNLYRYVWNGPLQFTDPAGEWGVGVHGGVSGGAGLGAGATATASTGIGVFGGGPNGVNTGVFGTAGAFAGLANNGLRYPNPPGSRNDGTGYVFGYGLGVSLGLFGTNAKSVCDLQGPFKTLTIGAGGLIGGEITIAWSGKTFFFSGSLTGSPLPIPAGGGTIINTNTAVKPLSGGGCGCK